MSIMMLLNGKMDDSHDLHNHSFRYWYIVCYSSGAKVIYFICDCTQQAQHLRRWAWFSMRLLHIGTYTYHGYQKKNWTCEDGTYTVGFPLSIFMIILQLLLVHVIGAMCNKIEVTDNRNREAKLGVHNPTTESVLVKNWNETFTQLRQKCSHDDHFSVANCTEGCPGCT